MRTPKESPRRRSGKRERTSARSWWLASAVAGGIVGVSVLISATVNPLFGRAVHWYWMAGLAPTLFAVLVVALRRRWI